MQAPGWPPAMPVTAPPRRSVHFKGGLWKRPRLRQGGPTPRRSDRLRGARWIRSRPQQAEPKARRSIRLKGARWTPARPWHGGPKATSPQHPIPISTKGTVRIFPRSCRVEKRTSSATTGDAPLQQCGAGPAVRANASRVNSLLNIG